MPSNAASPSPCQPSPSQREALKRLANSRPLLVQIHWAWASNAMPQAQFQACLHVLNRLDGTALTQARCDSQVIGADPQVWHTASVWALPSGQALQALIDSPAFSALSHQALAVRACVALQPSRIAQRTLRIARTVMRFLPAPAASKPIPEEAISGGVNPNAEQFEAFKASPQSTPIHMFNLLKFQPEVSLKESGKTVSGKHLYGERYAPVACQCIFRLGGRIVAMGRYKFTLIGQGGEPAPELWDEIVVAEYPGRSAFLRMLSNDAYQRAVEHRELALEATELWSASPGASA